MAPKKSERLKQKSFKTKPSTAPLVIHDESSESSQKQETEVSQSSAKISPKKQTPSMSKKGKEKVQGSSMHLKKSAEKGKELSFQNPSPKPLVSKTPGRKKNEVCSCSFIDFNFFSSNGFYLNELLEPIGCLELCSLQVLVFGECIKEFYENLSLSGQMLISKVCNQRVTITREDILQCLHMRDVNDDVEVLNLSKNELFAAVNGGLDMDYGREAMIIDFELYPRIIHKVLIECICPRKGSSTSMSIEHAQIIFAMIKRKNLDMATRVFEQIWRNRDSLVFGNVLMKLFEYKKISLPNSSTEPLKLKRIGKEVLHHMSIYVKNFLWYANDGSHYIHEKHRRRTVPNVASELVPEPSSGPVSKPVTRLSKRRRQAGDENEASGSRAKDQSQFVGKEDLKITIKEVIRA